jgi:hypothetical protein
MFLVELELLSNMRYPFWLDLISFSLCASKRCQITTPDDYPIATSLFNCASVTA